jgi:hypothetical protein
MLSLHQAHADFHTANLLAPDPSFYPTEVQSQHTRDVTEQAAAGFTVYRSRRCQSACLHTIINCARVSRPNHRRVAPPRGHRELWRRAPSSPDRLVIICMHNDPYRYFTAERVKILFDMRLMFVRACAIEPKNSELLHP